MSLKPGPYAAVIQVLEEKEEIEYVEPLERNFIIIRHCPNKNLGVNRFRIWGVDNRILIFSSDENARQALEKNKVAGDDTDGQIVLEKSWSDLRMILRALQFTQNEAYVDYNPRERMQKVVTLLLKK